MNCPKCQQPLQQDFRFCPYCGNQAINNSLCPACQSKVEADWIACPRCGSTLQPKVTQPKSVQPSEVTYEQTDSQGCKQSHRHQHGHGHQRGR